MAHNLILGLFRACFSTAAPLEKAWLCEHMQASAKSVILLLSFIFDGYVPFQLTNANDDETMSTTSLSYIQYLVRARRFLTGQACVRCSLPGVSHLFKCSPFSGPSIKYDTYMLLNKTYMYIYIQIL